MQLECCCECDEPTGHAGRADDSIFVELLRDWHKPNSIVPAGNKVGPLCGECYCRMKDEGLIEQ